jgi:signal transduction histidine kinase
MRQNAVILNVDDHEVARYARTRILTNAGFRVLDAGSGEETIAIAEKHQPDLILLDVHLPDVNGVEVCRRLKAAPRDYSVIVIQISASAVTASHATASLDAGADAYLMEPVEPDVLVSTVKAMLRLQNAERSLSHAKRELEIANKELRRSNEDLQQFAFAASHDLQEPLRAITTFSQLIQADLKETLTEKQNEYFQHILNGTGRMHVLIHDLLAYSQVGREDRPPEVVELKEVIAWALANLREQIERLGAEIEIPRDLPSTCGDFAHLGLVFQNLFSNSLKYRKPAEPPLIRVEAARTSLTECTIRVTDYGVGIAPEYQQRIFEPFKRLHGAEIPGTGLGLALCRRIVENLGGRIWVSSTPGDKTTFCLTLNAG